MNVFWLKIKNVAEKTFPYFFCTTQCTAPSGVPVLFLQHSDATQCTVANAVPKPFYCYSMYSTKWCI